MHRLDKPSRFRRLVSTLLSIALVAGIAPGVALAVPPGLGTITFAPPSAAGGAWVSGPVTITVPGSAAATLTYTYSGASSGSATTTVFPAFIPVTATGSTLVTITAWDNNDTSLETTAVPVRIDPLDPVTTATVSPSSVTSQTAIVSIIATDQPNLSGLKKVFYKVGAAQTASATVASFALPAITDTGTTSVSFWSEDNAGNIEDSHTVDVIIDKFAPTTTSNRVASYVNTATITLAPADTGGAGVKTTYYQLDGGSTRIGTSVVATYSPTISLHTLKFWSEDKAGNVESNTPASNNVTFTISADNAPPITTLVTKPGLILSNWQSQVVTFSLSATDTPPGLNAGVAGTFYRLDSGTTVGYTPSSIVTVNKQGTTTLEFWSVDNGGAKEATNTQTIKIDTVAPTSSNNAVATYDSASSISVSATDTTSGIGLIDFRVDGGDFTAVPGVVSGSPSVTALLPAVFSAGNHTVDYVVYDVAGNHDTTKTVDFHVTRQPAFNLTSRVITMNNATNPTTASIATYLKDGSTPLGNRSVTLEYSTSSTFASAESVKSVAGMTNSLGFVRFNVRITSRTYFRVKYAGDADYKATTSAKVSFVPKVQLSAPVAKTTQTAGRAFAVSGRIYPAHPAGTNIKIERFLRVGRRYVSRGYIWAKVPSRNRYTFSARMTLGRGTWRLRAVALADTAHATTTSGFLTIVVK